MKVWTPEEVKRTLPRVPVRISGNMILGHVRGRKRRFAQVYVGTGNIEVAWSTVAHVLNHPGRFVIAD